MTHTQLIYSFIAYWLFTLVLTSYATKKYLLWKLRRKMSQLPTRQGAKNYGAT